MPRGKRLSEDQVVKMMKLADKGKTFADIGRKFGINPDTCSIHVRAMKDGLWTPKGVAKPTGEVQASSKKMRVYQAPTARALTREETDAKLMRSQAKAAVKELHAYKRAGMALAGENLNLRAQIAKLAAEVEELRGE
jgi:hypothetical protein